MTATTTMKTVLTIAGSDCSGGAGIQADLKTIAAHGLYGMSVLTAITAQNTTSVAAVYPVPLEMVAKQIDCVFEDIRPDAVKLGMLFDVGIICVVADRLRLHKAERVVLDPVMISTSRSTLLEPKAVTALRNELFPLCTIITPNLAEAATLCQCPPITTRDQMETAAQTLATQTSGAVLVKGGHLADSAADVLWLDGQAHWLDASRIDNPNTHGTGCTLSSAIACSLAEGLPLQEGVARAKRYLTTCLEAGLDLGHGPGPLQHNVSWQ